MEELHVRTASIGALADALGAEATAQLEEIQNLDEAATLTLSMWEGDGAEAYRHQHQRIVGELTGHAKALQAAQELALALEQTYARADVELARLFGDDS